MLPVNMERFHNKILSNLRERSPLKNKFKCKSSLNVISSNIPQDGLHEIIRDNDLRTYIGYMYSD